MNTFFLSLLQVDLERRKNVTCYYQLQENESMESEYLKSRFPFLKKGDLIEVDKYISTWNGNFVSENEPFKEMKAHPFFLCYEDPDCQLEHLSLEIVDRISSSKTQRGKKLCDLIIAHLLIRNFKIGKTRYDLICTLDGGELDLSNKQFHSLEKSIRNDSSFVFKVTWDYRKQIDDYKSRYKKRLFLVFD
jgi:hypothetical protein